MNESSRPQSRRSFALWGLFFLSGAAALGYQILWAKMFALTLGHEFTAVVTVVAVFFTGFALGGAFAKRILNQLGPTAFARLEFFIGLWGLLTPLLILKLEAGWITVLAALPSTMAMGATLPAMAQLSRIPAAYAANTFGAVVGCLGTAYFLMPKFGLVTPIFICAAGNFFAAHLARSFKSETKTRSSKLPARLGATFFATGFLALGFETLGVRILSLSLENTVFTFAAILAVYLLGQSIGAAFLRIRISIIVGLLLFSLAGSGWAFGWSSACYEALRNGLGESPAAVFGAEIITTLSVFALPTLFMGALFVQLAERAGEGSLGRALLWNSMGAALGAVLVPFILFPMFGGASSLVRVPPGSVLREVRNGRMATVSVAESPDGHRTLFVNNRFQMGGTAAAIPELRHAHIPLLLHPAPRNLLVLGLGTGVTLSAAGVYPDLQADGVELLPEVVAMMPHFVTNFGSNIKIHIGDARRFIRQGDKRYDVIIADLFHPAQDGTAFLYTREHFARIGQRLQPDGLFCQWLPLHQLDLQGFRDITKTFLEVFPNGQAWLLRFNIDVPVVGLIGWASKDSPVVFNSIERRATDPKLGAQLKRVNLADSVRLAGSYLAGPDSLRAFAAKGRLNTDTFPVVMFETPAFSYRRSAPSQERLLAFMDEVGALKGPVINDETLRSRVVRFVEARDVYLRALAVESADRSRAIDGYVESARLSEDFTSGYAQCLAIATAESQTNPDFARRLLQRLVEAQPARPVAREMLQRFSR